MNKKKNLYYIPILYLLFSSCNMSIFNKGGDEIVKEISIVYYSDSNIVGNGITANKFIEFICYKDKLSFNLPKKTEFLYLCFVDKSKNISLRCQTFYELDEYHENRINFIKFKIRALSVAAFSLSEYFSENENIINKRNWSLIIKDINDNILLEITPNNYNDIPIKRELRGKDIPKFPDLVKFQNE